MYFLSPGLVIDEDTTYEELISSLGLEPGDQLTFVMLTIDDTAETGQFAGIKYARVVLAPKDGDFSESVFSIDTNMMSVELSQRNPANEGAIWFSTIQVGGTAAIRFSFADTAAAEPNQVVDAPAACAVIVSRRVGDVWQRSTSRLVLRPYTVGTGNLNADHGVDYLGDAVDSFRTSSDSTRYLNQAEQL